MTGPGGNRSGARDEPAEPDKPIIRDRRKVDPITGQVRHPDGEPAVWAAAAAVGEEPDQAALRADAVVAAAEEITAHAQVEELTADLQRVQAEFANYRKRVDRDRALAGEFARAEVVAALFGALDDIDLARTAGDLEGPFAAVAEKLEAALAKFGVERYGEKGDAFDPAVHEALMHEVGADVDGPTVKLVIQPGYRMGDRILRAARVAVADAG
ncbi:MAG: nucleotide exchange factor GrpE [Bifidobacteriaceae bacterium]|nr:nucleotide exchange factor GrpE [Bifidobacteriaceae bacterium]